jgi:hypothetical protein
VAAQWLGKVTTAAQQLEAVILGGYLAAVVGRVALGVLL